MAGWVVEQREATVVLPPHLKIAGLGYRLGAWLIDGILSGLLALVALVVAIASGGLGLNQDAMNQLRLYPQVRPDVPLLTVHDGLLIASAVLFVVLNVAYYAGCWTMFRATPAQRLLSLQVADARTGRTIPFWRAVVRWLALFGLSSGVMAGFMVVIAQTLATVSISDMSSPYYSYSVSNGRGDWEGMANLLTWVSIIWSVVLLVSVAVSSSKTGLHDRLAGTIVVGKAPVVRAWGPPQSWAQGYGQPPQGYGQPPHPPADSPAPPTTEGSGSQNTPPAVSE